MACVVRRSHDERSVCTTRPHRPRLVQTRVLPSIAHAVAQVSQTHRSFNIPILPLEALPSSLQPRISHHTVSLHATFAPAATVANQTMYI